MTTKLNKLINFIKENIDVDDEIKLYEPDLLKLGLTKLEIIQTIDELNTRGAFVERRATFAPNKIQSTNPKQADFSSVQNGIYNIPVFLLQINRLKFQEIAEENLNSKFLDEKATLQIGKQIIQLPPQKNEHCFCRAMFRYTVNKPVDWSEIYEEITGDEAFTNNKNNKEQTRKRRIIYDAMEAVNNRIKEKFDTPLFKWDEKTVRRLY